MFTSLLPWGPEIPRAGLVKSVTESEIEIEWEPPKREFTKYILGVDPNVNTCSTRILEQKPNSVNRDHNKVILNSHFEYTFFPSRVLKHSGYIDKTLLQYRL